MIYSLCDFTGNMLKPWADAGYKVKAYDLQNGYDVLQLTHLADAEMVFAFPPCDHLAVSGALHMKDKGLKMLANSLYLVGHCVELCENSGVPWMLENPVSTLSSYWRKPDYQFHPYEYTKWAKEDNYTKRTCIWCSENFNMPQGERMKLLGKPDSRILAASPGKNRHNFRSATPMGFARAVFDANEKLVMFG